MRTRGDLIRVGLFTVTSGAILIGSLLWIAGSRLLRPTDEYIVIFEDAVSGLNAGANVEYQGVVVGRVRDLRLTADIPPRVAVDIQVEPDTPIRTDTVAALRGSIVTGIQYIQLEGGTAAAPPASPGGTIRGDVTSLERFRDRLERIGDLAVSIMTRLEQNVFTAENATKAGDILDDLRTFAQRLNTAMETLETEKMGQNLAELVVELTTVTENVNAVVTDFYARRDDIYGQLQATLGHLDETVIETRGLVRSATAEIGGTGGSVGQLLQELITAVNRLEETLDVIQADPSVVVWGRSIPERERVK